MANPTSSGCEKMNPCPGNSTDMNPSKSAVTAMDLLFPGFSVYAPITHKYLHIDLNLFIPLLFLFGFLTTVWNYGSKYFWEQLEIHLMSSVDIRPDDEIYNMVMAWVANQRFSRETRRLVANTKLGSRSSRLWPWWSTEDDEDENEMKKKKALNYTPSFGTHVFWYRGHLMLFRRRLEQHLSFESVSAKEEITIKCLGRNAGILKELLSEAHNQYRKKDEQKTLLYRGVLQQGNAPLWQHCIARTSRPLETIILNSKKKKDLMDDIADYLKPDTQRWYSTRGIPYRRGYLLYGPPGTGKSSLSLALAGYFNLKIYIVSLSSKSTSEEKLATLFLELPSACIVLLEDIDTAGLTHDRDKDTDDESDSDSETSNKSKKDPPGQLSLSGLLNILDGVASQEGRILIMTTNHLEKLDKALIRPGRVDKKIEFGLADSEVTASIFRAIFSRTVDDVDFESPDEEHLDQEVVNAEKEKIQRQINEEAPRVDSLALEFASKIPAHEFSPAEIQGHLLQHKHDEQAAIDTAEKFVVQTRKDKKERDLADAKKKRKEEEKKEKEEKDSKKKEKEEKEEKEEEKKSKSDN